MFQQSRARHAWQLKDTVFVLSRFEGFTAVIMRNSVFWDIKASSYLTGDTLPLRYRAQPVNAM
jgi:hypothetical protein